MMSGNVEAGAEWMSPERAQFRRKLMKWHATAGRQLPWRAIGDPYRVWISEIMLQQTTVAAVIPYYVRFLERFPTVGDLAVASEQEVLGLWEGLGYYSRGRNLHRAAKTILETHDGAFPRTVDDLRGLPGVGRYTAGAIASFAFDVRAPIVEANTLRLHSRLIGYAGDPRSNDGQARLWSFAEEILPRTGAGEFNQALMDLGALICTPANPRCEECPVAACCRAFLAGKQNEIPPPKPRPEITNLYEAALTIRHGDRWLIRQRTPGEWWNGMWDFPRLAIDPVAALDRPLPASTIHEILKKFAQQSGVVSTLAGALTPRGYGVTRFKIHAQRIVADAIKPTLPEMSALKWKTLEEIGDSPLTGSARRLHRDLCDPAQVPPAANAKFQLLPAASSPKRKRNPRPAR